MKKMFAGILLALFCTLALAGCTPPRPTEQDFAFSLEVPQTELAEDATLRLTGRLENHCGRDLQVTNTGRFIKFSVVDEDGNSPYYPDPLVAMTLKQGVTEEFYDFAAHAPGVYRVSAYAEFDYNGTRFKFTSQAYTVTVTER